MDRETEACELKRLVQGYTASKWRSWDLNVGPWTLSPLKIKVRGPENRQRSQLGLKAALKVASQQVAEPV